MINPIATAVALFLILFSTEVIALTPQQQVTLNIRGRILEPAPCLITGSGSNGLISIEFGDNVRTDYIDGVNYAKSIEYSIHCTSNYNNALAIKIIGTPAEFGQGLLVTSVDNLAIKFNNSSTGFPVNTFLNFVYPSIPKLFAVPVVHPGIELRGQPFNATAIMQVYYQ